MGNRILGGVRGGGFSVVELVGTPAERRVLELKGLQGSAFPPTLRVNLVRVE